MAEYQWRNITKNFHDSKCRLKKKLFILEKIRNFALCLIKKVSNMFLYVWPLGCFAIYAVIKLFFSDREDFIFFRDKVQPPDKNQK